MDVTISLAQFIVEFQMLDALSSFNMLLERPWIYQTMVVS